MRLTVLGGTGGWPTAGTACSGYLVEHDGYRVLIDPGYATFPRLLEHCDAAAVDAVLVSHGHPDHCADLNPLLRARALAERPAPSLPLYAPPGALDAVLALDRPGMLDDAFDLREFAGARRLLLTHLMPGTDPDAAIEAASAGYGGDISVAVPGSQGC
jgi:ribonuclease BN (tRNA processing enzyme)